MGYKYDGWIEWKGTPFNNRRRRQRYTEAVRRGHKIRKCLSALALRSAGTLREMKLPNGEVVLARTYTHKQLAKALGYASRQTIFYFTKRGYIDPPRYTTLCGRRVWIFEDVEEATFVLNKYRLFRQMISSRDTEWIEKLRNALNGKAEKEKAEKKKREQSGYPGK